MDDLLRAGLPNAIEALVFSVADVWLPGDPCSPDPAQLDVLPEAVRHARHGALEELNRHTELAKTGAASLQRRFPQWTIHSAACADSPAWAVVEKARAWGADLLVVGAHSHGALERLFLGSVAQKAAAETGCSVRIARPRLHAGHSPPRILVAVDGSSDAETAVHVVAQRAWPAYTEIRIATVIDPKALSTAGGQNLYSERWVEHHHRAADEWICGVLKRLARDLAVRNLVVDTHVFSGDPKRVLLKEAERLGVDTLFLGARGLHHGDRLFLGSLASAVAARAHCSVEVIRPAHWL